jgi:hypothetical protein
MHQHIRATEPTEEEKAKRSDLKAMADMITWLHREAARLHVPFLAFLLGMVEDEACRISGGRLPTPPD